MTNQQIVKLLRDLQWRRWTEVSSGFDYKTCRGCGVDWNLGWQENAPKHKKECRIQRAITTLSLRNLDRRGKARRKSARQAVKKARETVRRVQRRR